MLLSDVILRGTSGAQPAATAVPTGTLYFQTDTQVTQRSNGTTWDSYSGSGGSTTSVGAGSLWVPEFGSPEPSIYPNPGPPGPAGPTGSGGWTLIGSNSPTTVDHVDFTGLSAYSDIRVFLKQITCVNSVEVSLRVSIDNGSTFLSTSGDYVGIAGNGAESATTLLEFYAGGATAARSGEIWIEGFNLTAPKVSRSVFFSSDSIFLRYIPTANALNAIRVFTAGAGGNMTAGTIYVFGR